MSNPIQFQNTSPNTFESQSPPSESQFPPRKKARATTPQPEKLFFPFGSDAFSSPVSESKSPSDRFNSLLRKGFIDITGSPTSSPHLGRSNSSQEREFNIDSFCKEKGDMPKTITYQGKEISLSPLLNTTAKDPSVLAKDRYSIVYEISSEEEMITGVRNDSLIIKIPYVASYRRANIHRAITKDSVKQYGKCIDNQILVAEILNIETCIADGFIIQRKVKAFSKAPWSKEEPLKDIMKDTIRKSYLEQIIELCASCFIKMRNSTLDLQWDNLGLALDENPDNAGKLILFDFMEYDDPFYLMYRDRSNRIASGNEGVLSAIQDGVTAKINEAVAQGLLIYREGSYYSTGVLSDDDLSDESQESAVNSPWLETSSHTGNTEFSEVPDRRVSERSSGMPIDYDSPKEQPRRLALLDYTLLKQSS